MNKKGFTLIELIVTIALIGLVGIVISFNMINTINNQKEDDKKQAFSLIEEAACAYAGLSRANCSSDCTVTGSTLINEGMIDEVINGIEVLDYNVSVTYTNGEKKCNISGVEE